MAANLADHIPIRAVQTVSGNTPLTNAVNEKAGQTFLEGVPVMGNNGVIQEWDATVGAASPTRGIIGIARAAGANLASDGAGAPGAFQQVGAPGAIATYGKVTGQSAAVNIAYGTPFSDGRTLFEVANDDTIWEAQFDNAAGGAFTPAQTDIGKHYGLTKDTTGHWYVDNQKSTLGTNTVLVIVGVNPADGFIAGARVRFKFEKTIQQFATV